MGEEGGRHRILGTGRLGRWLHRRRGPRSARQQGDVAALDVEGDPRGGHQSGSYRTADPRDLVEEDGVVLSGPGGSPQERPPEAR